jgi:gliding motility-associated-like protein
MKKISIYPVFLSLLMFCSLTATSQIAITTTNNASTMASKLVGTGVTISNATYTGATNSSGTFQANGNTNLNLAGGVVLTSGYAGAISSASSNFAGYTWSPGNGDADLTGLAGRATYDASILQFTVLPQGNKLKFQYVFGSEEYPEYVCSNFNDVFAFFITGPNPGGGNYNKVNLATVPGSNPPLPVSINSINSGTRGSLWNSTCSSLSYGNLYVNNAGSTTIIYDGFTTVLTAEIDVVPCQPYVLRLAISDAGDDDYDSGVFLQENSITSNVATITDDLASTGFTTTYEGCVNTAVTFNFTAPYAGSAMFDYVVTGTATNGVDYQPLSGSVLVNGGASSATINIIPIQDNIAEGQETVTISLYSSCSTTPYAVYTVPINDVPSVTASVADNTLCSGQVTQLGATGVGGFSWSPGTGVSNPNIANPTLTGVSSGTYTVSNTVGACVSTSSVSVDVSQLAVSSTATNATCATLGSIDVTASNGIPSYSYNWGGGITSEDRSGLAAGTYTVTVTDGYGCTQISSQTITQPAALQISGTTTSVSCNGGSDGSITVSLVNATAPVTYSWADGSNAGPTRTGLASGTYSVTAADANGCTAATSYTVGTPSAITITATPTNALCSGSSTGTITLAVSGGTPGYTYLWSNSLTTQNLANLVNGTYTVTVTDSKGCTNVASATVQTSAPVALTHTQVNVLCFGNATGSIDLTATGGTGPYNYNWGGGITTEDRSGLTAGTYAVTVSDVNNCSAILSATITQPNAPLTATETHTNAGCNGGTGSIDATVTGGTAPYTYSWTGGATTEDLSGIPAGTYTLTVTDGNGCTTTVSATISQPAILALTETHTNVLCNGGNTGAIDLTVSGGTAPYIFVWTGGSGLEDITGLTAGTYIAVVTDAHLCSATLSVTISQPNILVATETHTDVLCNGGTGSIDATITGGTAPYTYSWTGGATTEDLSGIPAGTYTLTVTDGNGCTTTVSATISQPATLTATETHADVLCNAGNSGSIDLTVSGGATPYTFSWTGGATSEDLANLTAGTYTVIATDANGCTATLSVTISEPTVLTASETHVDIACNGGAGSIDATVSGGTTPYTFSWTGGATSEDLSNLTPGTYTLTATDANGCTATVSATITQPNALTLTETHVDILCNGGNNGSIDLTVSGGTTPYTFSWTGGATSEDLATLTAGAYTVVATDANGCSATLSVTISEPATLTATETHADVLCNAGNSGSIDLTVSGGTTPYTFSWTGGATSEDLANLTAGTYTVIATDANGCTATLSVTISEPTVLTASETHVDIACNGGAGSIDATVSGGTTPYTFSWTGGATSEDLSNLTPGTYTLTATDANGCTATVSATITQPNALTLTETHVDILCNGGNNGSIDLTVSGGTTPYTFSWTGGATSEDLATLTAGAYTVVATDANGCSATLSVTISEPGALVLTTKLSQVLCNGTKSGAIDLTVSGGTAAYTFDWGNGITTEDLNGLAAGTYTVIVKDANGCTATTSATLIEPAPLALTETHTDVACSGNNTGSIDITVLGGTNPINTVWADGPTTEDRTGLPKGSYSLLATDANGCTASISVSIAEPDPISLSAVTTDIACNGGNDGAIDLTIDGGATPYTISWTGNIITEDRTGLAAGAYTVTVTDANLCTATASYTINQNAALQATVSSTNVLCFGATTGSVNATVTGGTTAYTYSWSNDGTLNAPGQQNLAAGPYTVTVTDAKGCTATASATIAQPQAALAVSATGTDVKCFNANDGTATASATGGTGNVTFNWGTQQTATVTGLAAGTYTVTATDANGCTATASVTINAPAAALQASTTVNSTPTCVVLNGSATASATGGTAPYTITWTGQQPGATITAPTGTYTANVTDANGCTATTSVTFTAPAPVTLSETHTDISCTVATGSIDVTINGGTSPFNTAWVNGPATEDRTGLAVGSYTLNVSDANGCTASITVAINSVAATVTATGTTTDPNCNGGNNAAINVSVSGAAAPVTFKWSDGNIVTEDRNNLIAGTYSVTATDANGCTATASFTIADPAALSATATKTDVTCSGTLGNIDVTVTGGTAAYTFKWNDGPAATEDRANLGAGSYTVTVTDSKGCTAQASASIAQPATVSVTGSVTNVSCKGGNDGSATISVLGGSGSYTVSWNTTPAQTGLTATNLTAGAYDVLVQDANGCSAIANVNVGEPATGIQALSAPTPNICYGVSDGTAQLSATGGVAPYSYTIELVNSSTPLNRIDGAFTELSAGTYNVSVTDSKGCNTKSSFVVPAAKEDKFSVASTPTSCFNEGLTDGKIELTELTPANAPYQYAINSGAYQAGSTFDSLSYGTYLISTKNAQGCVVNQQVEVVRPAQIEISFATDTMFKLIEETKELNPNVVATGNVIYSWSASSTPDYLNCDSCAINSTSAIHNINYTLTVSNADNRSCYRTADIAVIVRTEIRVPNVFTPNGDGNNDLFYPIFNNADTKITDFRVYNRWGQVIHSLVSEGWNGTFDAKDQPNGTFLYFVAYERLNTNDGSIETLTKQGEFTLLR